MSSILKALKKLEEEKTVRADGGVDIARGVLRSRSGKTHRRWILPVSVAAGAVAASLFTSLVMALLFGHPKTPTVTSTPAPQAAADAAALAHEPVPRPMKEKLKVVAKSIPAKSLTAAPVVPAVKQQPAAMAAPKPKTSEVPASPGPSSTGPQEIPTPVSRPVPALKVSGIAWNKDGNDRLAMVNGRPVAEGMIVDGARVEEISRNRVRFSFQKQRFEVTVGEESGSR